MLPTIPTIPRAPSFNLPPSQPPQVSARLPIATPGAFRQLSTPQAAPQAPAHHSQPGATFQTIRKTRGVYRQAPEAGFCPDFDALCDEIDGTASAPDAPTARQEKIEELAEALRLVLEWLAPPEPLGEKRYLIQVARKAIALIWVLRPELLGNRSLAAIAAADPTGTRAATFSRYAVEFADLFGVHNPAQQTRSARRAFRSAALARSKK